MEKFYRRLSYSIGNEDPETERKALQVQPGNRVIAVTASGDRSLNLLTEQPSSIVSVDMNPIQNYMAELKKEAMRALDFNDYLSFLGANSSSKEKRGKQFEKVKRGLSSGAKQYWEENRKMIDAGVLYQGTTERACRYASYLLKCLRSKNIEKLFSFDDLNEQRAFIRQEWDRAWWRAIFNIFLHPTIIGRLLKDPGVYKENAAENMHAGKYVYERMNYCFQNFPAKENFLASLFLVGKVFPEGYSDYLREEGIEKISPKLDLVEFQTGNVIEYLENAPEKSFDRFSLSDISSYMDHARFVRLLRAILRTAKPGARFNLRQFLSKHPFPEDLKPHFIREPQLEAELESEDRCFVYRYMVGEIAS